MAEPTAHGKYDHHGHHIGPEAQARASEGAIYTFPSFSPVSVVTNALRLRGR